VLFPCPTRTTCCPARYTPNIDQGIVTFDVNGTLRTIDWEG
jgi:hypothetical protein